MHVPKAYSLEAALCARALALSFLCYPQARRRAGECDVWRGVGWCRERGLCVWCAAYAYAYARGAVWWPPTKFTYTYTLCVYARHTAYRTCAWLGGHGC